MLLHPGESSFAGRGGCVFSLTLSYANETLHATSHKQNLTAKIIFKSLFRLQVPLPQSQPPGAGQVGYPFQKMNI